MAKETKYGLPSLRRDFPTDVACLDFIFETLHSRECSCGGKYHLIAGRRQFQCSKCRYQIAPTAGTVFHKSATPLTLWFQAILVFSNAKSGISSKQMERQLEVTYKCAYRILSLIRKALADHGESKLSGIVETDTGFIGGKKRGGFNNEKLDDAMENKSIVIAALERGGRARAKVLKSDNTLGTTKFILDNVEREGTRLMSDNSSKLIELQKMGYSRQMVRHNKKQWVLEDIHVNSVETWWSHIKRSIKGTYKSVSKEHLQEYLDAFAWHYSNRHNDRRRFVSLLGMILRVAR